MTSCELEVSHKTGRKPIGCNGAIISNRLRICISKTGQLVARVTQGQVIAHPIRVEAPKRVVFLLVSDTNAALEGQCIGGVPSHVCETGEDFQIGSIIVEEREGRHVCRSEARERRMDARERTCLGVIVNAANGEKESVLGKSTAQAELLAELLMFKPVRALDVNDRRVVVVVAALCVVGTISGDRLD